MALVRLGQLLFFEPALSGNYKRSCASCHRPQKAFTDQRTTARAYAFAGNLDTNTPTLLTAARQRRFFHDGRASTLNAVIEAVLTNPAELNTTYDEVAARLMTSVVYCSLFEQACRAGPSRETINQALGAYLRQLGSRHNYPPAYTRPGYRLFNRAGCPTCHGGSDLRDGKRHEVAPGRWIRTPTLRYLPLTPPYLADGTAPTLAAVLTSPFHARQRRARSLRPDQLPQLITFLRQLPVDTTAMVGATPTELPLIPGAPTRRVGGSY